MNSDLNSGAAGFVYAALLLEKTFRQRCDKKKIGITHLPKLHYLIYRAVDFIKARCLV
jgi:hypothetical protein